MFDVDYNKRLLLVVFFPLVLIYLFIFAFYFYFYFGPDYMPQNVQIVWIRSVRMNW